MINPTVARTDYSRLTDAVIRGGNVRLQASKEKNARIRASLAEVAMNNKASADAQAAWMGAISQNEDLLSALNSAPPRIQTAYKKAEQGRATLEDNSVIASYLGSIQKQLNANKLEASNKLKDDLLKAQIGTQKATALRQTADMNLANAERLALAKPGVDPRQATINALLSGRTGSAPATAPMAAPATAPVSKPPVAAINTSDPNDPIARPVAGAMLPEPTSAPAPAPAPAPVPEAPVVAPEAPVAAPVETPRVDPNAPFFTDAKGNRVVATPEVVASPEVAQLVARGVDQGSAIQLVQAEKDLKKKEAEYVTGVGNVANLPMPDVYTAQLVAAGNDLDDAREQTTAAIAQGMVYTPPTTEVMAERKKEFKEAFDKETASLANLLKDTQTIDNAKQRVEENLGFFTTGTLATWAAGVNFDYMPVDFKSSIELKQALSQITSDASLSSMQKLKESSKQGATGLGQVSVVEFTSLRDAVSSVNQALPQKDLLEAVNLYVYDRNKLAYNAYRSMVDSYGAAAINSRSGISERQVAKILEDINFYETNDPVGIRIAARSGYFVDNVGVPQAPVAVQSGPGGGTPASTMSAAEKKEQSIAAAEAVFNERQKAMAARDAANVANATKAPLALAGPAGIVPMAGQFAVPTAKFIAPKIYDFFGGNNAETESYVGNIPNIQTK